MSALKVAAQTHAAVWWFILGEILTSSIFAEGENRKGCLFLISAALPFSLPAPPKAWTKAQMHYGIGRDSHNP